ncbi:LLM class flavin-dependent oxidoreductase [Streptomyces ureilyticus]|uniref:LLM class flavin-dependent oxidoreductase n=1 Tax=Streptomyces ureilyticus TaxID=1775131 RepID=A0ABX0DXA9_9ACTN|nr:LLM class flavin-dependent oxidoreductase [Streptomyces ureilyticus]NGO46571.1 LLM class flavin-dependent oxidoreductase [Streptomyces ureilyticus]
MKTSVMLPFVPKRPEQALPFAGLVAWSSAARLWQGQGLLTEGYHVYSYLAGAGFRFPMGFGVSLMPFRHPYDAAVQARSLALTTGQSIVAGFGAGALQLQRSLLGREYSSQLGACREYLGAVRRLLDGEELDVSGEHFEVHGQLQPYPAPQVEVGLGVLRKGAAGVAGEVADAAITWLTPADYVSGTLAPAIAEGARRAERKGKPRIVAIVPVALAAADRDPVQLALASNRPHLSLPHYQSMLRSSGLEVTGDPDVDAGELVAKDGFLYGDEDELAKKVLAYRDAGVDEIVLNITGVSAVYGPEVAVRELAVLLRHFEKAVA